LSSETRHNLFLAFEETLNNVLKHSEATKVKVEMLLHAPKFEIFVTDNGRGFAPAPKPSGGSLPRDPRGARVGNGLKNLRQRLTDIGGECLVHSQPGAGTTVSMSIRLNQKATSKL
jgi:signal transduction histidine kinase